jgi:hypothetical protein
MSGSSLGVVNICNYVGLEVLACECDSHADPEYCDGMARGWLVLDALVGVVKQRQEVVATCLLITTYGFAANALAVVILVVAAAGSVPGGGGSEAGEWLAEVLLCRNRVERGVVNRNRGFCLNCFMSKLSSKRLSGASCCSWNLAVGK